ncbi:MAG: hypothetical protein Kow00109_15540 [Acidobacteriota bacterium]
MWETIKAAAVWLHGVALAWGGPGLFLVALADSSFLSIPEGSDILVVVLSIGASWPRMLYLVGMTVLGSVLGCLLLYAAAQKGLTRVVQRIEGRRMKRLEQAFQMWGWWAVAVPSILPPPTPFKLFVIAAGVFQFPLIRFVLAVAVGRFVRYVFWGALAVTMGERAKDFMKEGLPTVGIVLFVLFCLSCIVWWMFERWQNRFLDERGS